LPNSVLHSSLEQAQSLAADRLSQIHRVEDEFEHHQPSHPDHWDEHHILAAELKQLTQHLHKLESDNTDLSAELVSLRSSHQVTEVLREQIRSPEAKAAHTDSLRQQLDQLQVPPSPSTASDNQALASLRLEHTDLLDKRGFTLAAFRTNIPIPSPSSLLHSPTSMSLLRTLATQRMPGENKMPKQTFSNAKSVSSKTLSGRGDRRDHAAQAAQRLLIAFYLSLAIPVPP